ncbi:MAG: zinc-ribbon domain-containing protein [Bacilli bacterium]|nr:zinc-ribbon domain-containing protein [Bacilli bacterium]
MSTKDSPKKKESVEKKKAFCPKCGNEVKENEVFCPSCGNQLKENQNGIQKQNMVNNNQQKGKSNGLSTAGFICALFGFITCGLTSIIGLILSCIGLSNSKKNNQKDGLAIAGIIISSIMFIPFFIGIVNGIVEGINAKDIIVPDFSSMTRLEAEKWCEENEMKCDFSEEYSDVVSEGEFISQEYATGEKVKSNIYVDIIYSKGERPTTKKEKSKQEKNNSESKQETKNSEPKQETPKKTEEEKKAEYIASCEYYGYKDIGRQPEEFKGKKARFRGRVLQIKEDTWNNNKVVLLVQVTENEYGWWDDSVYVTYKYKDGESRILEEDIINMYGTIEGTTSYYSVLGAKITVPAFTAKYIDIEQ